MIFILFIFLDIKGPFVFLSYDNVDKKWADQLKSILNSNEISCFMSRKSEGDINTEILSQVSAEISMRFTTDLDEISPKFCFFLDPPQKKN